jgi:predicted dinucleotide-binding enzyme
MRIGILGVGHIGKTLALKLSAPRHDAKVANPRGPETIEAGTLTTGARAVTTAQALHSPRAIPRASLPSAVERRLPSSCAGPLRASFA